MDLNSLLIGTAAGAFLAAILAFLYVRSLSRQWTLAQEQRLADKETELQRHLADIAQLRIKEDDLELEINRLTGELESAKSALKHERESAREKIQLLEETKTQLKLLFENTANKIFEEKSARLTGQSVERLTEVLKPLKDQLGDFKKKVEDVYDKEGRERTTLLQEIKQLKDLNNRVSKEATDLTLALKGESKTRGNWGELVLERVLEQSGLTNGREYETQVHLKDKYGGLQGRFPDIVVHLPEGRDVIIDSKVTLNAYERFVNAGDPVEKAAALKEHINATRLHIKGLSAKNYQDLEGINPMELVLMCVPNESAFIAAVAEDVTLHDDAMQEHVVLVGPTTLLLTLRIIAAMWRTERQNQNALEIAERGKLLYEKLLGFVEDLEAVGAAVDRAGQSYRDAHAKLTSGSGNLVGQANKLIDLGVKARKKLTEGQA
jgi:DNA recombination protein RmuC